MPRTMCVVLNAEDFLADAKLSLSSKIKKNIDNINTESAVDLHLSGKYHHYHRAELDHQESELSELKNAIKCSTTLKSFTLAIDCHFKNLRSFLIDILTSDAPLEALQIYGLETVADAAVYEQLLTGLVNNTTLNTLILDSAVGDDDAEFFCNNHYPALNECSVMEKEAVDFDWQKYIAAMIFNSDQRSNQNFNILKLSGNKYATGRHLLTSDFDLSHLGETSIVAIIEFLKHNKKLRSLRCHNRVLSEVGVRAIAELMSCHQGLTSLNLSESSICDAAAIIIAEKLQGNNQLTTLILHENKIGDEGASAIANALTHNISLLELDLAANKIKSSGIKRIADSLTKNDALLSLDLSGNQTGSAVISLDVALDKNRTLQYLFYSTKREFGTYRRSITEKIRKNNIKWVKLKNIKQAKAFLWAIATIYVEWSQNQNSYLAKLPRELIEYVMRYLLSSRNNDDNKYAIDKKNALVDFLKIQESNNELEAYIVKSADKIANDYYQLSSQPERCSYMRFKADYTGNRTYTPITRNTNLVFAQFSQETNHTNLSSETSKQNLTNNVSSAGCKRKQHSDAASSATSSSHFAETSKRRREIIIIDDDDIEETPRLT